jgi:hypothetical protein
MTLDWHFQPHRNKDKTLCKALNRFKLCQSTIVPTVQLEENQLIHIDQKKQDPDYDKKDGACGIAPDLLDQVWRMWHKATGTKFRSWRAGPR